MDSGSIPEFNVASIVEGGGVVTGAYYLAIAYADKDFTETNVLGMANPVYVHTSSETYIPFEMIGGSAGGVETNKSIKWDLTSLNIDYKYIVPYVLQKIGDVKFVYKLEFVEIKTTTISITYSGLEQVDKATVEDAVLDKVNYLSAKSIAQLDNRMYAANLTGRKDLGFQRFANGIQLEAITKNIVEFDPRSYDLYNINYGYTSVSQDIYADYPQDYQYISQITYPLQNGKDRGYRNIYYSPKMDALTSDQWSRRNDNLDNLVAGFTTSTKTRPLMIEKFREYAREKTCIIRSKRLVDEMKIFIWKNSKAQAQEGYNDDLVMSFSMGLYLRDTALRFKQYNTEHDRAMLTGFNVDRGFMNPYSARGYNAPNQWQMPTDHGNEDLTWLIG
jgi:hypothetical protein